MALLLWLLPQVAAAQDWSLQWDAPASLQFQVKDNGGTQTLEAKKNVGVLMGVGTPYHVGFGIETFGGTVNPRQQGGLQQREIAVNVWMADVFLDVPVPWMDWLAFSVGSGYGEASFDPPEVPEQNGQSSKLHNVNLWQFFATLGVKLPWGLSVHAGYHEYNGRLRMTGNDPTNYHVGQADVHLQLSTVGLRYTF
jgi:hypothetical protein